MKNIRPVIREKYQDSAQFEKMDDHIYKQRADNSIRITLSCDLEESEDSQYPLEYILDKFLVNCTDYFVVDDTARTLTFEVEGSLGDMAKDYANILEVAKLIGRRVFNKGTNKGYFELTIE